MADPVQPKGLTMRLKEYFGLKQATASSPAQTLGGFAAEVKALSSEDKAYYTQEFNAMGLPVEAGKGPA